MSLSAILGNALSGLNASQVGMRAASNNVANVNTPGYARTTPIFQSRSVGGMAMGVETAGVKRVADRYLQSSVIRAMADAGGAAIRFQALDRLQSQFGSLDDQGSLFSRMNTAFNSLAQAGVDPTLSVARLSAASDLQSFFDEAQRLSTEVRNQRLEADGRISSTLGRVNEILGELLELNANVQSLSATGGDVTGAANRQAELMDELSGYMDVRADYQPDGRVVVRTSDGVLLLDNFATELRYTPGGSGAYETAYGRISAHPPNGAAAVEMDGHIQSGEIRALMDLRDQDLPQIAEELAELTSGTADALNKAHNNSTAFPAPNELEGRNTGLDLGDDLHFTGATTFAVTDSSGALIKRIDVDFDAGTLSVDGGAAVATGMSIGTLRTALDTALGADGNASFTNGVFRISAADPDAGIAILDDAANPSQRAGRGFSHFFGLNDLVRSDRPAFFETGFSGFEDHNFSAGEQISFRVASPDGRTAANVDVVVAGGGTFNDLLTQLNDATNGLGRYMTFSLNADGALTATPQAGYENFDIDLTADNTARAGSNLSFSDLFGVGLSARAGRAEGFSVDSDIRANSSLLALGQMDIDATSVAGDTVLNIGDNRGSQALQSALNGLRNFDAAGSLARGSSSLQDYAARFAGSVGARAASAESAQGSAESLLSTATTKRADVEGVNLDEELANMTLYQTSYNASARMLQAAKEMTETLLRTI